MSRQFGMATCDWCFAVIEGRAEDYCSDDCKRAHESDLGIEDEDEQGDEPDRDKDDREPEPLNP